MPNTPEERCPRTGKARHPHRSGAVLAAKNHARCARARGTRAEPMSVFRCRFCAGWHVGNPDDRAGRTHRKARRPRPDPPDPVLPDEDD